MADSVLQPTIYDVSTGQPADITSDQIPQALSSGKYAFQKGAQIPVLNSDQEPGSIPAEQIHQALQNGYQYDAPEQQLDRIKTEQNSGFVKGAEAFGAGAARGATLGLSDQVLTKTGMVQPQTLSDLNQYRPNWSGLGEAAGVIGGTLLDPGVGPLSMVAEAGKGATAAADMAGLNLAGHAMETFGGGETAAKVLAHASDIGSHAIGSAVEGAIYSGVGNSLTEQALGDPDLNGQKVMANFGYGALFGGVLGGTLRAAGLAFPESIKAAGEGLTNMKNYLVGTGEDDGGVIGNMIPDDWKLSDAFKNRTINLDADEKADVVKSVTDNLNEVNNNVGTALKTLNTDIRPQETSALINSADKDAVIEARQNVLTKLGRTVDLMESKPAIYSSNAAAKAEDLRLDIVKSLKTDKTPQDMFNTLLDAKQRMGKMVFTKIPTETTEDTINALLPVSKLLNDTLKNPDIFGHAGAALAAHDELLSRHYDFISPTANKLTDFQKAFGSKVGNGTKARWQFDPKKIEGYLKKQMPGNITGEMQSKMLNDFYTHLQSMPEHLENTYASVPNAKFEPEQLKNLIENSQSSYSDAQEKYLAAVQNQKKGLGMGDYLAGTVALSHPVIGAGIEAYNVIQKPLEAMNKLAEVERLVGKATNMIGRGVKAVFAPVVDAADSSRNLITKLSNEDRVDAHSALKAQLSQMQNNPQHFADMLHENTDQLYSVAPNMATSVQQTGIRAAQFMQSKLPIPPKTSPFSQDYVPSSQELAKFERYQDIVNKPTLALDQIKSGTLVPETNETLSAVYPALYEQMKAKLLQEAAQQMQTKGNIPYQIKQSIGQFVGQPIEQSMSFMSVMKNQMAFQQNPQPNQGPQQKTKPSLAGMREMKPASRISLGPDKDDA